MPGPVVPQVKGTITLPDGTKSRFTILLHEDGPVSSQWGATRTRLGRTVDLVHNMREGIALEYDDLMGDLT